MLWYATSLSHLARSELGQKYLFWSGEIGDFCTAVATSSFCFHIFLLFFVCLLLMYFLFVLCLLNWRIFFQVLKVLLDFIYFASNRDDLLLCFPAVELFYTLYAIFVAK